MKRVRSASECDDEEDFSDRLTDGEPDETTARKRRRGLIEKKRRDRINSCLTELRKLVPAALEKQGSAKLEKAEILQLTVEHLKRLRNAAAHSHAAHNSARAMEHRTAGFHQCLSEVARYVANVGDQECTEDEKAQLMKQLTGGALPQQPHGAALPYAHPWPFGLSSAAPACRRHVTTFQVKTEPKEDGNNEKSTDADRSELIPKTDPSPEVAPPAFRLPIFPVCRSDGRPDMLSFGLPMSRYPIEYPLTVVTDSRGKVPAFLSPWGPTIA